MFLEGVEQEPTRPSLANVVCVLVHRQACMMAAWTDLPIIQPYHFETRQGAFVAVISAKFLLKTGIACQQTHEHVSAASLCFKQNNVRAWLLNVSRLIGMFLIYVS